MKEITLTITIEEANLILEGLGAMPFNKVYQLIGQIQQQAGAQLQENGSAPATKEAEPVSLEPKKK